MAGIKRETPSAKDGQPRQSLGKHAGSASLHAINL